MNELTPFMVKETQERIIEDVYLYLLGSDDSKLRLETARSLTRFVSNMSCFDLSSTSNQNSLLSMGEVLLKTGGYANNMFNSSLIDNDFCNLSSIGFLFNNSQNNSNETSSKMTSFNSTTNILYSQRQVSFI